MVLDVQEVGRVLEGWVVPVQVAHPLVEVWVARPDVLDVALEMLDVDGLYHGGLATEMSIDCGECARAVFGRAFQEGGDRMIEIGGGDGMGWDEMERGKLSLNKDLHQI